MDYSNIGLKQFQASAIVGLCQLSCQYSATANYSLTSRLKAVTRSCFRGAKMQRRERVDWDRDVVGRSVGQCDDKVWIRGAACAAVMRISFGRVC